MSEDNFVRLAIIESESEALAIKSILEENQIEVKISGQEPSALGFMDGDIVIELFVRQSNIEKSKSLIDSLDQEESEPIPAWTCECGEEVDEGFYVCWSCNAEYQAKRE